jgi:hypothetical protein
MTTYDLNGRQRIEVLTFDRWAKIAGSYPPEDQVEDHKQEALHQFLLDNGQAIQPGEPVTIVWHDDGDDMPIQLTW